MKPSIWIAAALLLSARVSLAQDALVEGPGYQLTESSVLHPSVGAEAGFDSNVFREDSGGVASPILRLLADLDIASRPDERRDGDGSSSPAKVDFRAGIRFLYTEYLSGNSSARAQRDLGVSANASVDVRSSESFSFHVGDTFERSVRPRNFESNGGLDRDVNRLNLKAEFRPGGGSIAGTAGYQNLIDRFESSGSAFANRLNHDFELGAKWQFLPITKFYVTGSLGLYGPLGDGGPMKKVSSTPLRGVAGIATAITENTTVRLEAGWKAGFYSAGDSYSSFIGLAEFGFRYSPVGRVVASYTRDYRDSINANFFADHKLKLQVNQELGRVVLDAGVSGRLREYQGISSMIGAAQRTDVILGAKLGAQYIMRDWLAITGSLQSTTVQTDYRYVAGMVTDDPSFSRTEILGGIRAAF